MDLFELADLNATLTAQAFAIDCQELAEQAGQGLFKVGVTEGDQAVGVLVVVGRRWTAAWVLVSDHGM